MEPRYIVKTLSGASILLYPSYIDTFSLSVLESMAMGLHVVAYKIPALKYYYGNISSVHFVPVGDYVDLALTAINVAEKLGDSRIIDPLKDPTVRYVLRKYSSWENVAEEETKYLLEVISKK